MSEFPTLQKNCLLQEVPNSLSLYRILFPGYNLWQILTEKIAATILAIYFLL